MVYPTGDGHRTDPHRVDPYKYPGVLPHELGTRGDAGGAGWWIAGIMLAILGLIVLLAMSGGAPDAGDTVPAAAVTNEQGATAPETFVAPSAPVPVE
ncbi:hypothetical protein C8D95_10620 [Silicimonas algicola]|uniref:Uncharacterized protein n=1 Tax=Silicimonas algicola TaxID=1826607 RepID=A0A316G5W1_9RHOB|nr:hypothetical protein C8D95_10620 [Silicimonas algicola]